MSIDDFNSYVYESIVIGLFILPHFTLLFVKISVSLKRSLKTHLVVPELPVTLSVKDTERISSAKHSPKEKIKRIFRYRRDNIFKTNDNINEVS